MKLNARIVSVLTVLALAALVATAYIFARSKSPASSAASIVAECSGTQDHAQCYEAMVPLLYPEMSVPQLFEVLRGIRSADPSYQFCHVLAHKIGERVVAEDPEKWIDAIPMNPQSGLCSNGFIHGVIGGRFRSEVLSSTTIDTFITDFKRACEPHDSWHPSDLDRAICYHGLGHLYDFITNADLPQALNLCERTTTTQFHRVCVEGVFMQIYQPLEPDDYALIEQMKTKPTAVNYRQFCASFKDDEYVGACLRESWPLHPGMVDGTGIVAYCSGQPNADLEDYCYLAGFTIIGRLGQNDRDSQAHACTLVTAARQNMCFSIVANAIIEEDRDDAEAAVAFCSRAPEPEACLRYLTGAAQFNFGYNGAQYKRFCEALPSDMRSSCFMSAGAASKKQ